MTSYGGEDIVYDAIGNPIIIGYQSDGVWYEGTLLDWEGRQLVRTRHFENTTDSNDISGWDITSDTTYTYNADGIRTGKNASGTTFEYILNGSQLIGMRWTRGTTEYLTVYIYDDTGSPIGMKYRTGAYAAGVFDTFFFEKNLQGDIVAVYTETGTKLCGYIYDAWGNWSISYMASGLTTAESAAIGYANPFRYRGYIYESDIGGYYLQSRFYNPAWGRFLNADGLVNGNGDIIGYNLYAYCSNNPVMLVDLSGFAPTDSVDTDGDGEIDYYIYAYEYTIKVLFMHWVYRGNVYIFVNKGTSYVENPDNIPKGFDRGADVMVVYLPDNSDAKGKENKSNMYVYQADSISNPFSRSAIINCLDQFDKDFNTPWERSKLSVREEWLNHMIYAPFSDRAKNVDFDNPEEGKGFFYFLKKAWNCFWGKE